MDVEGFEQTFGKSRWPQKPFYAHAFVADVQRIEDDFLLMLELLSSDGESVSPALFQGSRREIQTVFNIAEPGELEAQWRTFRLALGGRDAPTVLMLSSLSDPEGISYEISDVASTPIGIISAHSSPGGTVASIQEIERFLLRAAPKDQHTGLAVLDVGQGSAAFLYSDAGVPCIQPSLYLDIGGGCVYNAKTFPAGGVKWCFTKRPGILLSHWHWDHWAGATFGGAYNVAQSHSATWLVPSTPPGPFGKKLISAITAAGGKVMHWSPGTPPVTSGKLTVGQATGTGWNNSGLVLLAELEPDRFTLVPGDAAYIFLPPALKTKKLKTLLISHHGGYLEASPPGAMPMPDGLPDCHAYCSVGDQNTYGHPTIIADYASSGWHVVRTDTRLIGAPAKHFDAESGGLVGGVIWPCCNGNSCSLKLST